MWLQIIWALNMEPPNTKTGHTLGFVTAGQVGLVKFNVGDGPGQ